MEGKYCTMCKEYKDLDRFAWKTKKTGRRASECKDCHNIIRNKYYKENGVKERTRIKERKKEIKKFFSEYKNNLSCVRCGENHISTLQFHHRDPSKKDMNVSVAVCCGWSIARVFEEIEKCEVLCANCHFKEHWDKD